VFPANGVQYLRIENITSSGAFVNSMVDQIGAASPSQTGSARPALGGATGPGGIQSVNFDGVADWFPRVALAASVPQPGFVSMVFYVPTGANTGSLVDDTPATAFFRLFLNFANIRGYNGGGGSWPDQAHVLDTWMVMTVVNDNLATALKFGAGAYVNVGAVDGGPNPINGLSLGADSSGAGFSQFRMTDRVIGSGGQAEANAWHSYLRTLRGL